MSRSPVHVAALWLATAAQAAAAGADPAPEDEPFRVVAFGDSVTKGVRSGVAEAETFEARLEAALKPTYPRVRVLNAGIGGNTVRHAWTRIVSDVVERRPAFCTIMFGINDSYIDQGRTGPRISIDEYEQRLRSFVRFLRHHAIEPILMTSNPMTARVKASAREPYGSEAKGMNFLLERYCNRVRAVAKDEGVPLIDVYREFWEAAGQREGQLDGLLTDGMHPNPVGHQLIADRLAGLLKEAMANRAKRPLPTQRADENLRRAQQRLARVLAWERVASYDATVLPNAANPRWATSARHDLSLAKIEGGALRMTSAPDEPRRALSFTLKVPCHGTPVSVTYRARISADSKDSPYLSVANGETKAWTWLGPTQFLVSRFDRTKDRLVFPIEGTAFHTYRLVLAQTDLYVFIDGDARPKAIAPGWLVPSAEGRYVQFALPRGRCDTFWERIDVRLGVVRPVAKRRVIVAQEGGPGRFATVQAAVDSITDATADSPVEVVVKPGTYQGMVRTKDWINVVGEDRDQCILSYTRKPDEKQHLTHVIWATSNSTLKNLTLVGRDVKYCIHSDGGREYVLFVENCLLRREYPEGFRGSRAGFGIGLRGGQHIVMHDCVVHADRPIYLHNWDGQRSACSMTLERCRLEGEEAIYVSLLGSGQRDCLVLHDCTLNATNASIFYRNHDRKKPPLWKGKSEITVYGSGNTIVGPVEGTVVKDDERDRLSGLERVSRQGRTSSAQCGRCEDVRRRRRCCGVHEEVAAADSCGLARASLHGFSNRTALNLSICSLMATSVGRRSMLDAP